MGQNGSVSWLELQTYSPRLPTRQFWILDFRFWIESKLKNLNSRIGSSSGNTAAFVAPTVAGQQGNSLKGYKDKGYKDETFLHPFAFCLYPFGLTPFPCIRLRLIKLASMTS